jgi:ABC-2 type transport system ATP-binding protein
MIEVQGLTKVYEGLGSGHTRALDNVTFGVEDKSIFGFLGPNGAGKTTTIRILATILRPTSGRVAVADHDISTEPMLVQRAIGYVPEGQAFYPTMTGNDHLVYWAEFYGLARAERRKRAKELLEYVGLGDAGGKKVKAYSLGMKKRLTLAQALVNNPDLLILDEPAGGLDPFGIIFFRDLAKRLNSEGHTIFLSSHLLSEIQQTCNTVGIINRGHIIAVDSVDHIRARMASQAPPKVLVELPGANNKAVEVVKGIKHVREVTTTDWGLVIGLDSSDDVRADINAALMAAGFRVAGIRTAEPTLEDAFVALTGEGRRAA